jgi:hypothetical protein
MRAIGAVAALFVLAAGVSLAEEAPTLADIWTLKLGTPASALPRDAFVDYACGSNGGPPPQALTGWSEYHKCQAEPNGLREVSFRYDDEIEYWANAHRARTLIAQHAGTKVLSVLGAIQPRTAGPYWACQRTHRTGQRASRDGAPPALPSKQPL